MMFLRLPDEVEADWAEDTEYDQAPPSNPSEASSMSKHQEVQHEFGPSWCSVCKTQWPCKAAS